MTSTKMINWWTGFNGTFSRNRLYCAFEKYVAVKIWN